MRTVTVTLLVLTLAACSVSLPQKPPAGSVWNLRPPTAPASETQKPFGVVVAKPWLASGFDTRQVRVTLQSGEMDALAGVVWSANYGEWLRNYFIEGLQSSGRFSSVTGNQSVRGNQVFLKLYLWDLSVHYDGPDRSSPVVVTKMVVSVTNGRGEKLVDQQVIHSRAEVSHQRLEPIMNGFRRALEECFQQTFQLLSRL